MHQLDGLNEYRNITHFNKIRILSFIFIQYLTYIVFIELS